MQVAGTRCYRVRDVAEHCAVPIATIHPVSEPGQLAAVQFGRGTGTLGVSGAAARALEQACVQAACGLLGIDYARAVVVA